MLKTEVREWTLTVTNGETDDQRHGIKRLTGPATLFLDCVTLEHEWSFEKHLFFRISERGRANTPALNPGLKLSKSVALAFSEGPYRLACLGWLPS